MQGVIMPNITRNFDNDKIKALTNGKSKVDFMLNLLMPEKYDEYYKYFMSNYHKTLIIKRILNNPLLMRQIQVTTKIYNLGVGYKQIIDYQHVVFPIIPKILELNKKEINEISNKLSYVFSTFVVKHKITDKQEYISINRTVGSLLNAVYLIEAYFKIPISFDRMKYLKYTIKNKSQTETNHLKKLILTEKVCYDEAARHNYDIGHYDEAFVKEFFRGINNDIGYKQIKAEFFLNQK